MRLAALFSMAACFGAEVGPAKGSLVIVGGGRLPAEVVQAFVDRAGGAGAPVVLIPTAGDPNEYATDYGEKSFLAKAGLKVTVMHTRDKADAEREDFAAPLRTARGVWFGGGRQWRLVDSFLDTRVHREIEALLARGGVVGGTSAGATIQGSYLVRGAREGNTIMMAPGYEVGMGFLKNSAIDQHLLARKRQEDLVPVIDKHPKLLGIGIDESTAIVVEGDTATVIGASKVAIYDKGFAPAEGQPRYYFLGAGERFDLKARRVLK